MAKERKLIRKITEGYVAQWWDADTKQFVGQEFKAGNDSGEYTLLSGNDGKVTNDPAITSLYHPFDMEGQIRTSS